MTIQRTVYCTRQTSAATVRSALLLSSRVRTEPQVSLLICSGLRSTGYKKESRSWAEEEGTYIRWNTVLVVHCIFGTI